MVALGRVVVDHVEDHLDAGGVQRPHHGLELVDHPLAPPGGIAVVGGEKTDGVVPPVIAKAPFDQTVVVDELVDGHQLDSGDAQTVEMLDHRRVSDAGVGAPVRRRAPRGGATSDPRTWVS